MRQKRLLTSFWDHFDVILTSSWLTILLRYWVNNIIILILFYFIQRSYFGFMLHFSDLMQILTDYTLRELSSSSLYTPISSKTILPSRSYLISFSPACLTFANVKQPVVSTKRTGHRHFCSLPRLLFGAVRPTAMSAFFLWSTGLSFSSGHISVHLPVRPPFPFRCAPFVSPGPPPTRALINFLDGAHYRPDCRQIPTPRRDT